MKVLAVCVPGPGHVQPLLPLVGALVDQGDEVLFAIGEDPGGMIARAGAAFRPAGHGEGDWFAKLMARTRGVPGDGLAPERIAHYFLPRLFAEIATADMIDDVLARAGDFEPDLVLFETYAFAGPLAAELLGVPAVHHLISPMLSEDVMALADDALRPLWRSFGHDSPGYGGVYRGITIQITPDALEPNRLPAGEGLALRPAPVPGQDQMPVDPPLVYVTLGTFFNANTELFRTILEGLAEEAVQVVATVGHDQEPSALGAVPGNARVERFIPQHDLLPRCSLVVHHGGSGTMFGAMAHGIPQVVLPQGADNFANGRLLGDAGLGHVLPPEEVTAERVGDAVRTMLGEPSFVERSVAMAREVAAMPDSKAVASALRERFSPTPR